MLVKHIDSCINTERSSGNNFNYHNEFDLRYVIQFRYNSQTIKPTSILSIHTTCHLVVPRHCIPPSFFHIFSAKSSLMPTMHEYVINKTNRTQWSMNIDQCVSHSSHMYSIYIWTAFGISSWPPSNRMRSRVMSYIIHLKWFQGDFYSTVTLTNKPSILLFIYTVFIS